MDRASELAEKIIEAAQASGATSCRMTFAAGGTIRVFIHPLYGMERYLLEEKLRWKLPHYDVLVFTEM